MKLRIVYKEDKGSPSYKQNRNSLIEKLRDKTIETIEFDIDEDTIDIVFTDNSVLDIESTECNVLIYKDSTGNRLAGLRD